MLWYILRAVGVWLMTVPGLSAVPIVIHQGANYFNKMQPLEVRAAKLSDWLLFLFILTITAIIDSVQADRKGSTYYFGGFALLLSVLYYTSLVQSMALKAIEPLGWFVIVFTWGICLPYAVLKVFDLWGKGKAEWEASQKRGTPE